MAKLSPGREAEYKAQYKQQQRRINRYYRELQRRGYAFDEFRPIEDKEYVTKKDIEKLKDLTWKKILKKAYYVNELGQYETGTEAHRRIAREKREETIRKKKEQLPPEDKEILFRRLVQMLETFDAYAKFRSTKVADSVNDANNRLYGYIIYAWQSNEDNLINTIAANYDRLVGIISHVQDYVIVQGEITEFEKIIIGGTMSFEENLKMTEDYNDNSMLPPEELDDYSIIDIDGDE